VRFGFWEAFPEELYGGIMHDDLRYVVHTDMFFKRLYCTCEDTRCMCFPDNHATLADRACRTNVPVPLPVDEATLEENLERRLHEREKWCAAPRCRALRWHTASCEAFGGTPGFCEFHTRNGVFFTERSVDEWMHMVYSQ